MYKMVAAPIYTYDQILWYSRSGGCIVLFYKATLPKPSTTVQNNILRDTGGDFPERISKQQRC